ncbi:hypothetical protein M422DRAFT_266646 [Sphaerobolus stellatus SS14]|uniref:Uncharacterized protein n=1 Tax=Sphaerobolus stellatus (strain SS14) TaxID=990650 RepID=A0A0C9V296_SPHS4|nr:hypothetical protein M422DRAFT_266646 [Sphaerobolus stellatus SS14]
MSIATPYDVGARCSFLRSVDGNVPLGGRVHIELFGAVDVEVALKSTFVKTPIVLVPSGSTSRANECVIEVPLSDYAVSRVAISDDEVESTPRTSKSSKVTDSEPAFVYESWLPTNLFNQVSSLPRIWKFPCVDLERFKPGNYFRDELINFGLALWYEHILVSASRDKKLFVLSTFFWSQYSESGFHVYPVFELGGYYP